MSSMQASSGVEQAAPSSPATSQRQLPLIFVALMLAMLLAALDQTIVSTALTTIVGTWEMR